MKIASDSKERGSVVVYRIRNQERSLLVPLISAEKSSTFVDCWGSHCEGNMTTELRKSAGSDIKRLQEMVKRLEEQNAQLKSSDLTSSGNASSKGRVMGEENMVKVKLNLDDVPLLDLNAGVEEDEDTWQVQNIYLSCYAWFATLDFVQSSQISVMNKVQDINVV